MLQHDNARPHVARICTQFLEAENIPVLAWPAYSADMSPIEHVWDALDRHIRQRVPVPANIQQLRTAIEEEWTNIPQATINNLINSMWRRWQMVVTPDTDWFSRIFFFIFERNRPFVYIEKVLDLWVPLMKKWGQKQKCCVYIFVQCMSNSMLAELPSKLVTAGKQNIWKRSCNHNCVRKQLQVLTV